MSGLAEQAWIADAAGSDVRGFFSELGVHIRESDAANVLVRCFANPQGHKAEDRSPSCSVNMLTGVWRCHGCGESGNAFSAALALGFVESRARMLAQRYGLFLEVARASKQRLPTERRLGLWRVALRESVPLINRLGELKGWTRAVLIRCGVGWDGERLIFPVRAPAGRDMSLRLVGVVRYLPGGSPKSLAVGARGLFPPPEVCSPQRPLFVVEGEPAVVSVRSVGFQAVAVPGAQAWRPEWVQRLGRFSRVVVLPDCDKQGRELGERIAGSLPRARVVDLEPSAWDSSDIGDWVADASREGGLDQLRRVLGRLA